MTTARLLLCLTLASLPALAARADEAYDARLNRVEGTVYLHTQGQPAGAFTEALEGTPLEEGDLVRTGSDGRAEISLDGGTLIEVEADSDFIVNSLAKRRCEFHLGIGSLVAKVRSLFSRESMQFRTTTAVAAVRGTELGVAQEGDDQPARVGIFDEGRVSVSAPEPGARAVEVGPGQETELAPHAAPAAPKAMSFFASRRTRLEEARARLPALAAGWKPLSKERRLALRRALARRKALRGAQLKNVRADRRERGYEHLKERRELLRRERPSRGRPAPAPERRKKAAQPKETRKRESKP